jgi:hypothetical protein
MGQFFVGLDLGQSQDFTALVVAERTVKDGQAHYQVPHLQRFRLGTSYPVIVDRVKELLETPPLQQNSVLVVDATGCGKPVLDMFIAARLPCRTYGVWITGGDMVTNEWFNYRVPKRDLVGIVSVLLQSKRLKIIDSLPDSHVLEKELLNFRVKIDPLTAHDSYSSWREADHDDLVLATALAVWLGQYQKRAFSVRL